MAERTTECFIGIQDDNKDAYRGDTIFDWPTKEAVIPVEVGFISYRVGKHDESKNDEAIRLQLDLMDEVRTTVG